MSQKENGAFRSAATVSRSIQAATEGIAAPRRSSNRENCTITAVKHLLVATSLKRSSQLQQIVEHDLPRMEKAPEKRTDDDVLKLITAVQQIMTGIRKTEKMTAFLALREQFMVWLCETEGHNQPYPDMQHI
jgi:thioester reductase-like protein